MNSSFWVEDVTHPFFGRYFTLNLGKRITPNYVDDQIFLHLRRRTNFTIFIYHSNFFLLNSNILSFPMIIKDVSSSMGNHYWNLAMTERLIWTIQTTPAMKVDFDLLAAYNHPSTGPSSNFEGRVKYKLSFEVGWDLFHPSFSMVWTHRWGASCPGIPPRGVTMRPAVQSNSTGW